MSKASAEMVMFTREEVSEAYQCLRTHNKSIPDECLDQMYRILLAAEEDGEAYTYDK